jgi:GTP-binding protein
MVDDTQTPDELARLFNSNAAQFLLGVAALEQLPESDRPECALIGRSNVGKSSLFNALFDNASLARVSNTPGRTQQLNFFNFRDEAYIVDVPGYGYAKAPPNEVKKWQAVLKDYLRGRVNLRRAFLLIDSRHGINGTDLDMMKMLDEAAVAYQIILTKTDKISATAVQKVLAVTADKIKKHAAASPDILSTSAEKKIGMDALRAAVFQALLPA